MKIVVTGPKGSGKTTFIQRLDTKTLSVDEVSPQTQEKTTVALDVGKLEIQGVPITIFGTPGLIRFSTIRSILFRGTDAILVLIDSSKQSNKEELDTIFHEILEESKKESISINFPILLGSTKIDLPNHKPVNEIQALVKSILSANEFNELRKTVDYNIFSLGLNSGDSPEFVIKYAFKKIMNKWKPILEKADRFSGDFQGLQEALKISKEELKNLLNDLELRKMIELDRSALNFKLTTLGKAFLHS